MSFGPISKISFFGGVPISEGSDLHLRGGSELGTRPKKKSKNRCRKKVKIKKFHILRRSVSTNTTALLEKMTFLHRNFTFLCGKSPDLGDFHGIFTDLPISEGGSDWSICPSQRRGLSWYFYEMIIPCTQNQVPFPIQKSEISMPPKKSKFFDRYL